ncbi:putative bifunctional diguanylate cyclase/phosphodiesterase [Sphingomonas glacialis]|uniref:putative bifunctional diguanylate cyclase/phosphodiesterase n=1 Tax=Sphingomonas glacialis TaxID=658225 RepID=UPI001F4F5ECE|nr:EAL domain-containing protein [Sphingomonas glacialis]
MAIGCRSPSDPSLCQSCILMLRTVGLLFKLDTPDHEIARAQFRSLAKQVPLLYLILICNTAAITSEFFRAEMPFRTLVIPTILCVIASVRAIWWLRQNAERAISDEDLVRLIRRTCNLAFILTMAFEIWSASIYGLGRSKSRGQLIFFLSLTEVSTIFCLMSIRAAAMRVAAVSMAWSIGYFAWIGAGQNMVESIVMFFVSGGLMVIAFRYNSEFTQMIHSRRDLRLRQIESETLSRENARIAVTDALSGLPNRRHLLARLDTLESELDRPLDSVAIVFVDLDGFKEINDAHGHHAGDLLIGSLSERLRETCPPYATLARIGGDEFAVLVETHGATAKAVAIAKRYRAEINLPVLVDQHVLQVGSSIGIAGNTSAPLKASELLRRADTAMYHVKTHAKGEIAVYQETFDEGRLHRIAVQAQIGAGLARNEFDVVYQPIVNAKSGAIVAAEALIRWPGRSEGPLSPDHFIGIAEATGQILSIGLFVLERACRDFQRLTSIKLSVNVSPAQFRDPTFHRQVAHILEQTRFPARRLQFEITEGYLLADAYRAIDGVRAFRAMGISVALDDFGTGFTSIHYLQSYGFSHIKIDKSLLEDLHRESKASMLIEAAVLLAKGLDMRVVAEGVET